MELYDIKEMISELRKIGFTQEAIAAAVKVNQSMISRICSGKYKKINLELILKIQNIYKEYCRKEVSSQQNAKPTHLSVIINLCKSTYAKLHNCFSIGCV